MRRSDILFWGVWLICVIILILSLIFGFKLPDIFSFWWSILIPYALVKVFFPNSKITKWFEQKIKPLRTK